MLCVCPSVCCVYVYRVCLFACFYCSIFQILVLHGTPCSVNYVLVDLLCFTGINMCLYIVFILVSTVCANQITV